MKIKGNNKIYKKKYINEDDDIDEDNNTNETDETNEENLSDELNNSDNSNNSNNSDSSDSSDSSDIKLSNFKRLDNNSRKILNSLKDELDTSFIRDNIPEENLPKYNKILKAINSKNTNIVNYISDNENEINTNIDKELKKKKRSFNLDSLDIVQIIRNITTPTSKKTKLFYDRDVIIFFDRDAIEKYTKGHYLSVMNKYYKNKIRNAKKKLRKRNINYYIYTLEQLNNLSNYSKEYIFDDNKNPKFNELYYKLPDFNEDLVKYYNFNNFMIKIDEYKFDYYSYLFSRYGLKKIEWCYNDNEKKQTKRTLSINLKKSVNNGLNISNERNTNNNLKIYRHRKFDNLGSLEFFLSCYKKMSWYSNENFNKEDIVLSLLEKNKDFNYNYYKYNRKIDHLLDSRLNGLNEICYEFTKDTNYELTLNKMMSISSQYGNIGIKINKLEKTNHYKNCKYILYFYNIDELELKTINNYLINNEDIIKKYNLMKNEKNYKELLKKRIEYLKKELIKEINDKQNLYNSFKL